MIVCTSTSYWRWVWVDASIPIVCFELHCLIAHVVITPHLVTRAPFTPAHHNVVIEHRSRRFSCFLQAWLRLSLGAKPVFQPFLIVLIYYFHFI